MDGIEATRRITAADDGAKILMLTTFDLDEYVYDALRAGASGFLLKDRPPEELVQAVRVVASGDALLAPAVTRRLIEEFAHRPEAPVSPRAMDELTEREREVLVLMARGLSNGEIAACAVRGRDDGQDARRPGLHKLGFATGHRPWSSPTSPASSSLVPERVLLQEDFDRHFGPTPACPRLPSVVPDGNGSRRRTTTMMDTTTSREPAGVVRPIGSPAIAARG